MRWQCPDASCSVSLVVLWWCLPLKKNQCQARLQGRISYHPVWPAKAIIFCFWGLSNTIKSAMLKKELNGGTTGFCCFGCWQLVKFIGVDHRCRYTIKVLSWIVGQELLIEGFITASQRAPSSISIPSLLQQLFSKIKILMDLSMNLCIHWHHYQLAWVGFFILSNTSPGVW